MRLTTISSSCAETCVAESPVHCADCSSSETLSESAHVHCESIYMYGSVLCNSFVCASLQGSGDNQKRRERHRHRQARHQQQHQQLQQHARPKQQISNAEASLLPCPEQHLCEESFDHLQAKLQAFCARQQQHARPSKHAIASKRVQAFVAASCALDGMDQATQNHLADIVPLLSPALVQASPHRMQLRGPVHAIRWGDLSEGDEADEAGQVNATLSTDKCACRSDHQMTCFVDNVTTVLFTKHARQSSRRVPLLKCHLLC